MTRLATVALVLAVCSVAYDYVQGPHGVERAAVQDRAILRLLGAAALVLFFVDPVPGVVLALGLLGWWRERDMRLLLLAAGMAAVWLAAPLVAPWRHVVAGAWAGCLFAEGAALVWHWGALRRWWPGFARARALGLPGLSGGHGQHTFFASAVALVLPLAWAVVGWPVGVLFLGLLVGVSSWQGILAGLVGLVVLYPWLTPWAVAVVLAALVALLPRLLHDRESWLDRLPRGDSLDSIRYRWRTQRVLLGALGRFDWRLWLVGRGWTGAGRDLLRAHALGQLGGRVGVTWGAGPPGTLHNDVFEIVYGNGVLGLIFLGLLVGRTAPGLALGDPWSACVVVGVVVALGSSALHYPAVGMLWWIACSLVAWR